MLKSFQASKSEERRPTDRETQAPATDILGVEGYSRNERELKQKSLNAKRGVSQRNTQVTVSFATNVVNKKIITVQNTNENEMTQECEDSLGEEPKREAPEQVRLGLPT
jgi:hypothetical protein